MDRRGYADCMIDRLSREKDRLRQEFLANDRIPSFVIDRLLEEDLAREICRVFPKKEEMKFRNTFREKKYVAVQMDQCHPILKEIVYAFQDPRFIELISEITGMPRLLPDESLYAAGLSLMDKNCFLSPHVDNSHDADRKHYRALNLLYYISEDWQEASGGNFELWDQGLRAPARTILSRFNRLVVMKTTRQSWHSVNRVTVEQTRRCVSTYYFSAESPTSKEYYHVTSFRGRPEEKARHFACVVNGALRNLIGKVYTKSNFKTFHIYKKKKSTGSMQRS